MKMAIRNIVDEIMDYYMKHLKNTLLIINMSPYSIETRSNITATFHIAVQCCRDIAKSFFQYYFSNVV